MKISTKTGDKGETSLFGGRRVSKSSPVMGVLGELDELHSFLGWCKFGPEKERRAEVEGVLVRMQDDIYRMMAIIGFEMKVPGNIEAISESDVLFLEETMSKYEEIVGGLDKFVRPGGTEAAARFHIARTVCRRAERNVVAFNEGADVKIPEEICKYLNRLSDLLFVVGYSFERL